MQKSSWNIISKTGTVITPIPDSILPNRKFTPHGLGRNATQSIGFLSLCVPGCVFFYTEIFLGKLEDSGFARSHAVQMHRAAGCHCSQECPVQTLTSERACQACPWGHGHQHSISWGQSNKHGAQRGGPGPYGWGYSCVGMAMPLFQAVMSPWGVVSGWCALGAVTVCCFFLREVAGSSPVKSVLPPLPIHSYPLKSLGRAQLCWGCCSEAANQVERSQAQAKTRWAALSPSQEKQGWVEPNTANHSWDQLSGGRQGSVGSLDTVDSGGLSVILYCCLWLSNRESQPQEISTIMTAWPSGHAELSQRLNTLCV